MSGLENYKVMLLAKCGFYPAIAERGHGQHDGPGKHTVRLPVVQVFLLPAIIAIVLRGRRHATYADRSAVRWDRFLLFFPCPGRCDANKTAG